jgi:hypothetical protein
VCGSCAVASTALVAFSHFLFLCVSLSPLCRVFAPLLCCEFCSDQRSLVIPTDFRLAKSLLVDATADILHAGHVARGDARVGGCHQRRAHVQRPAAERPPRHALHLSSRGVCFCFLSSSIPLSLACLRPCFVRLSSSCVLCLGQPGCLVQLLCELVCPSVGRYRFSAM